jgi:hypothetical protein
MDDGASLFVHVPGCNIFVLFRVWANKFWKREKLKSFCALCID